MSGEPTQRTVNFIAPGMTTPRTVDELVQTLFRPGPRYLLGAFAEPAEVRTRRLTAAADWAGLDALLRATGATFTTDQPSVQERWTALFRAVAPRLGSSTATQELVALADTLDAAAMPGAPVPTLDAVWKEMSCRLISRVGDKRGTAASTLRGRKWSSLRRAIAEVLVTIASDPASAVVQLPRPLAEPSLFDPDAVAAIGDALGSKTFGGLVVLNPPRGWGGSELALRYASQPPGHRGYLLVRWLRSADPLQLDQDFLRLARDLVPNGDEATIRYQALAELERLPCLLVFDGVADPVDLVPYLPRSGTAHRLCVTSDAEVAEWQRRLQITPLSPPTSLGHDEAPIGTQVQTEIQALSRRVFRPLPSGDLQSYLEEVTSRIDAGELAQLLPLLERHDARELGPVRLALALVRRCLEPDVNGLSVSDVIRGLQHDASRRSAPVAPDQAVAELLLRRLVERHGGDAAWAEAWIDAEGPKTVETASLRLLAQLTALARRSIPTSVLGNSYWTVDPTDRAQDERLDWLERRSLIDRAWLGVDYVDVTGAVAAAVGPLGPLGALSGAPVVAELVAHRVLEVMAELPLDKLRDEDWELLPHALEVARAARDGDRPSPGPMVVAELYARSAVFYRRKGRLREAYLYIDHAEEILVGLAQDGHALADLLAQTDRSREWPLVEVPDHRVLHPPLLRMALLIRFLRRASFSEGALTVFRAIESSLPTAEGQPAVVVHGLARTHLAAARVLHELGGADVASHLRTAKLLWEQLDDLRWLVASRHLLALRHLGEDDLPAALAELHDLPAEPTGDDPGTTDLRGELARAHITLGLVQRARGSLADARHELAKGIEIGEAVDLIRREAGGDPRADHVHLRLIGPRTTLAAVEAELGLLTLWPFALEDDVEGGLWDPIAASTAALGVDHRETALTAANVAYVHRTLGQFAEARQLHREALAKMRAGWGADHPLARDTAFEVARTAASTGDVAGALTTIVEMLNADADRLGSRRLRPFGVREACRYAITAEIIVEGTVPMLPTETAPDADALESASITLEFVAGYFRQVEAQLGVRHSASLACDSARAELLLRRGEPREAAALMREAIDTYVVQQLRPIDADGGNPDPPMLLRARARLFRAEVLTAPEVHDARWDGILADLQRDMASHPGAAFAALDIALAGLALDTARFRLGAAESAAGSVAVLDEARRRLDEAIVGENVDRADRPLRARRHAELALLALEFGFTEERAIAVRERDRNRPSFPPLLGTTLTRLITRLDLETRLGGDDG